MIKNYCARKKEEKLFDKQKLFKYVKKLKSSPISASALKKPKHIVNRVHYSESTRVDYNRKKIKCKFKFKEEITFIKTRKKILRGYAVCIGYNPAKSEDEIDSTNKTIINSLWKRYDGYILYNLYPQVLGQKEAMIEELKINQEISTIMIEKILKTDKDVILFWGRKVLFDSKIREALIDRIKLKKKVLLTTSNNNFWHPARRKNIEINRKLTIWRIKPTKTPLKYQII